MKKIGNKGISRKRKIKFKLNRCWQMKKRCKYVKSKRGSKNGKTEIEKLKKNLTEWAMS